jgi:hypothetical protein
MADRSLSFMGGTKLVDDSDMDEGGGGGGMDDDDEGGGGVGAADEGPFPLSARGPVGTFWYPDCEERPLLEGPFRPR